MAADEAEIELDDLPAGAVTGIPVGYQTREFLRNGAPLGSQRTEAVHAARNLLGAGHGEAETTELVGEALGRSPQDAARPWTYTEIAKMVHDLASKPTPPPKPVATANQ